MPSFVDSAPERGHIDEMQAMQAMTEKHVQKHTTKTDGGEETSLRQQSFEDCCTYCDVHHNKRLSSGKHRRIEAWTSQVNERMAANSTHRIRSASVRQNVTPKYPKYVPPGRPDVDKGFRRIATPLHMRKSKQTEKDLRNINKKGMNGYSTSLTDFSDTQLQKDQSKLNHRVADLSQHYYHERQNVEAEPSRLKSANSIQSKNHQKDQTVINEEKKSNVESKPPHPRNTTVIGDRPQIMDKTEDVNGPSIPNKPVPKYLHIEIPSQKNDQHAKYVPDIIASDRSTNSQTTQLGTRTTSNRLLNMTSIDDSFRQHRDTLATTSPWIGPKIVERDTLSSFREEEADETTVQPRQQVPTTEHLDKNHTRTLQQSSLLTISEDLSDGQKQTTKETDLYIKSVMGNSSHDNQNGAVLKGFENLQNANEATNNTAYKGLYKFDESCGQPLNQSRGSKRFNRMNRNLHQLVEAFHIHGTPLSRKIHRRKNGGPIDGDESSATGSRPQSGSSQASYKFTSTPKFRVGSRGGAKITSIDENSTTEDGRESFLEMIMDMDKKKSKDQSQVNIHTYLYV